MKMRAENKKIGKEQGKKNGQGRWRRREDGTYYVGICPFNHAVCKLRNAIVARRTKQVGE